jgi:2-methylisocitrate lyase-like PEP mutase family enzyme
MIGSTPVIPFCYAEKSEQLCSDLGFDEGAIITALDLATDTEKLARAWELPVLIDDAALLEAERGVTAALQAVCNAIKSFD